MRAIGLFEAKAKLSEICETVARTGESVVLTRRGKPLCRIDPLGRTDFTVWDDRERYLAEHELNDEFELPERATDPPADPLDDA